MFNKRGQQEVSMGTILLIVIGIVAVVLVVVAVTGGFAYFGSLFEKAPGDLEVFTQACIGYAEAGLYNDYCREFREGEIFGIKGVFNCQYDAFEADIKKDATLLDCGSRYDGYDDADSSAVKYCAQEKDAKGSEFKEETNVNGESCAEKGIIGP